MPRIAVIVGSTRRDSINRRLAGALDWATRPAGNNVLAGKPCAVAGTSSARSAARSPSST